MNQQLLVLISEGVLALFLVIAFIVLLMANIYDVKQAAQRKSIRKMQPKFRRVRMPTITILVYAQNGAATIENCLESIRRNRYPNYDIVVVSDLSTDDTRGAVRLYVQKHPHLPIRLYSKRSQGTKPEAFTQGYRRSQKGNFVLVIDATNAIPKSLLKDSATRFVYDDKLDSLHFNINNSSSDSITLLYYRFLQLSQTFLDKFYASIARYQVNPNTGGSMYSRLAFRNACKSSFVLGKYDSDLVVSDCSVSDDRTAIIHQFSKVNNIIYYLVFAIVTILLQTYSMYVAATLQSSLILTIGWLATAFWLLIVTWSSEALDIKDKITLSFCAPSVYFLIYVQLVIYVIFITTTAMASLLKYVAHEFVIGAMAG
jgi:glycosyltransferase involved in cell wall biosynthesis